MGSPRSRLAFLPVLALITAACNAAGAATAPPASSTTASDQPCPTAPAPSDTSAWQPPASPPSAIPLFIANPGELVCGPNRILLSFLDQDNNSIGAPDRTVSVAFYDLGRDVASPIAKVDGTFVWAIENERGDYILNVDFPEAGAYGAEITTAVGSGPAETTRTTFDVEPSSPVVKVGDHAPASKTPTLSDVGGDPTRISTDPSPDPALYQTSVDQALANHQPFVLIFATPKFCVSAQCGPTLDRIKPFVARYPSVAFINVEPYKLKLVDGELQADVDSQGQLQPTDTTLQWNLQSEPWVFVVDRNGIVRASYELIFSDQELTTALDSVK
jgi:hypothetical protein